MQTFYRILLLALVGAMGTISRYAFAGFAQKLSGAASFPIGTLAVNAAGCLLFGIIWSLYEGRIISPEARLIILVGFMGAFTTFSTFAFETSQFLRDGQIGFAALNIIVQNVSGIAVFFLGLFIGRILT